MQQRRAGTVGSAALIFLLLAAGCAEAPVDEFDRRQLEGAEDLTEALANDLLRFSVAVRDRDRETQQRHVAETVDGQGWPEEAPKPKPLIAAVTEQSWPISEETASIPGADWLDSLNRFLERFSSIEDARFKVKQATFESGQAGDSHIKFFLVGRDRERHRTWIKGTAHIAVERPAESPWRLTAFRFESLGGKTSGEEIFSEVAYAAGIGAVFPPFGVGKNDGFVSHGAAVADVDNDGLLDLAATGVERNYLYLNQGDGTFEEVGESSLVKYAPTGSGALFLDYDNDGDSDLFLAAVGNQILLENRWIPDGELKFWDVSEKSGVQRDAVGFSAISSDVNGDGLPDVYVCSYNRYGTVMPNSWYRATNGTPNLLLINRGDGTFEDGSEAWGVADSRWTYTAGFVDIDEDGDSDLYVANDFGENALYRNEGDRFVDVAAEWGVVDPGFGMGVSWGDYDNDGDLDLHITNMSSTAGNRILKLLYPEGNEIRQTLTKQAAGNSLYENLGDGSFRDVTEKVGGLSGGWGFGGGFIDVDNDGWEDLYNPNGFVSGKSMKDT